MFFRSLPKPVLSGVPDSALLDLPDDAEARATSWDILKGIDQPYRDLLEWLVEMMADVAEKHEINKMNSQNCAIVMGPNLYSVPKEVNSMNSLILSQKAVTFFAHLVDFVLERRQGTV